MSRREDAGDIYEAEMEDQGKGKGQAKGKRGMTAQFSEGSPLLRQQQEEGSYYPFASSQSIGRETSSQSIGQQGQGCDCFGVRAKTKKGKERSATLNRPNVIRFPHSFRKANYVVVNQQCNIKDFVENHLFAGELNLEKPEAIISVTGGAKYFELDSTLDSVIRRGLIQTAIKLKAWIIDGGMNAGVMKYIGQSVRRTACKDIQCIGVATLCKVNNFETLQKGEGMLYTPVLDEKQKHRNIDPNHNNFIFVESEIKDWGEEIPFLDALQRYLAQTYSIPIITIAINGGYTALDVIANSLEQRFSTILLKGTGRACDAIAELVHVAKKRNIAPADARLYDLTSKPDEVKEWNRLADEIVRLDVKKDIANTSRTMSTILKNYDRVLFFDPSKLGSALDMVIYKDLNKKKANLADKLESWIKWSDKADLVQDLLCEELVKLPDPAGVLSDALAKSILFDRPNIFETLCDYHAVLNKPLKYFYDDPSFHETVAMHHTAKIPSWRAMASDAYMYGGAINARRRTLNPDFEEVLNVITSIGSVSKVYANLCSQYYEQGPTEELRVSRMGLVDVLVWAIFMNRPELAKVIWQRTQYPIHSAILACNIYRRLAKIEFRSNEYLELATWFEDQALKILDSVTYQQAKELISFRTRRMLGKATLEDLALEGECKRTIAHPHFQQWLDEILYSHKGSHTIEKANRSNLWLILSVIIFLPMFAFSAFRKKDIKLPIPPNAASAAKSGTKSKSSRQEEKYQLHWNPKYDEYRNRIPENHIDLYYKIPVMKFWTSSLFYVVFLFLQAYVLLTFEKSSISLSEYILWYWIFSFILEEVLERYHEKSRGYFSQLTNHFDWVLIALHLLYISLRVAHTFFTYDGHQWSAAMNMLLLASIISWLRLMAIFPVSSTFGPLFFILIRLCKDLMIWLVLFAIFAISFQIGFSALALQAGVDPLVPFPQQNGILPVSLVTLVDEWSYLLDIFNATPTGVVYLVVYAFIVQIMFVNLLIAMMGSTYSNVQENSDVEWKYYRCSFVRDTIASSSFPPPLNIISFVSFLKRQMHLRNKKKQKDAMNEIYCLEKREAFTIDRISTVMREALDNLNAEQVHQENNSPLAQINVVKTAGRESSTKQEKMMLNQEEIMAALEEMKQQMAALTAHINKGEGDKKDKGEEKGGEQQKGEEKEKVELTIFLTDPEASAPDNGGEGSSGNQNDQ